MRRNPVVCSLAAFLIALTSACTASGNLYFLSVQRIGIEAAASDPTTNAMPKINIGYESIKGTINPVKVKDGELRPQAYSVLGITSADASGSAETGLVVSEWFATGKAADLIAANPMAPAALAGTHTLTPDVLGRATKQQLAQTYEAVDSAFNYLSGLPETEQTSEQKALLAGMEALHTLVDDIRFKEFHDDGTRADYDVPDGDDWSRVTGVRQDLSNSIVTAYNVANHGPDDGAKQAAADAKTALEIVRAGLDKKVLSAAPAQAMWKHVVDIIQGK